MNIFKKAQIKLMPGSTFKEIGNIATMKFDDKHNRVFICLQTTDQQIAIKIRKYALSGRISYYMNRATAAPDKKTVALFNDMLEKLKALGIQDIILDGKNSDPSWPVVSAFIPIDLKKHSANRKIVEKIYKYTDCYKPSHNVFHKSMNAHQI